MSNYSGLSPLPLPGSRMVIAGGCGGIGREISLAAVSQGIDVTVLDLAASISSCTLPDSVTVIECDATDEESVKAAFARVEQRSPVLDSLINLVGYAKEQILVEDMEAAEWDEIMNGTLRSAFLLARSAMPLLRRSGAGSIVLTSGTFGVRVAFAGYAPYAVAKAGIINLTRALATEGAPTVRANSLSPGLVDTQFLRGGTGRAEKKSRVDRDAVVAGVPLQRIGRPEDMVGTALFLCSPAAAYITSQTIHVNGGLWS